MNDVALVHRAFAAYFRSARNDSPALVDQPSGSGSYLTSHNNKHYVVLTGGRQRGALAVYRVRTDGVLKRLRRWSKDIED